MPFKYIPDVRSTEKKSDAMKIVQILENKKQYLDYCCWQKSRKI
jgi:hypothetical protein